MQQATRDLVCSGPCVWASSWHGHGRASHPRPGRGRGRALPEVRWRPRSRRRGRRCRLLTTAGRAHRGGARGASLHWGERRTGRASCWFLPALSISLLASTLAQQAPTLADPTRRVSVDLHKCSRGAAVFEKGQPKMRPYNKSCRVSSPRDMLIFCDYAGSRLSHRWRPTFSLSFVAFLPAPHPWHRCEAGWHTRVRQPSHPVRHPTTLGPAAATRLGNGAAYVSGLVHGRTVAANRSSLPVRVSFHTRWKAPALVVMPW